MEEQEIIERIDKFFDKEGLDIQSKYFITKKINEEYWEEIQSEEDQEENDLLDELGEEEPEEQTEESTEEPEEEIAAPKPIKKRKITVKKPKVAIKKGEPPKEQEDGAI